METPPAAVASVIHRAAPMKVGDTQQLCSGCGTVLQDGEPIGEWPAGTPVVVSSTLRGGQTVPFEGITPGQFPECSTPR